MEPQSDRTTSYKSRSEIEEAFFHLGEPEPCLPDDGQDKAKLLSEDTIRKLHQFFQHR